MVFKMVHELLTGMQVISSGMEKHALYMFRSSDNTLAVLQACCTCVRKSFKC